jgi:hypothetical protein
MNQGRLIDAFCAIFKRLPETSDGDLLSALRSATPDLCSCSTRSQHERSIECGRYSVLRREGDETQFLATDLSFSQLPHHMQQLVTKHPQFEAWPIILPTAPPSELIILRERNSSAKAARST